MDLSQSGVGLQYQVEVGAAQRPALRFPEPRAEKSSAAQPADEIPRQSLSEGCRAERESLGEDPRRHPQLKEEDA